MSTADGSVVGTTKIVDNGPPRERWDLVIVGDGYQTAQLGQFATDTQSFVDKLFATAPFDALASAINVHRVDVTSTDSGADDPATCGGTGVTARTYFDASFCHDGQTQRLLDVDHMTALSVAGAQVPSWNMIMVIVNSTVYGGSGGPGVAVFSLATDARGNPASEIGLHEMGHTVSRLADEYTTTGAAGTPSGDTHPPVEPFQVNVTIDPKRATIKWGDLIEKTTPLPTTSNADCTQPDPQGNPVEADTVGAFEGANYFHCGAYRPQFHCRMQVLGIPYCAVCERQIRVDLSGYNGGLRLLVADFGFEAGGWLVEHHPRFMADTTGDGRADIVGFADDGVWISRAQPDGSYSAPQHVVAAFGYLAGGWLVEHHPRFMADTTADGRADIVGFADDGVWISRAQPDGSFTAPAHVIAGFGYGTDRWRVEHNPRFMADTTGDGRADMVGFGTFGVWVSRAKPDGSFAASEMVVRNFGEDAGGWRVERHPRMVADITGDGRGTIVGFADDGVWVPRTQLHG